MDYQFSDRVLALKPSIIREILKNSSDPSVIPFSAGNPAPEAFPAKEIAEISQAILSETPIAALQYSITEGYTPLRETISAYMKSHHQIGREFDDIIVTSGAQQVMNLASKVLCNEEDVIICEAPSFIGSLNTFRSIKTRLRGISMEEDGMNMQELEQALKEEPNARMIYTIPNFQNPSGITMSLEKRKKMYQLAKQYGVIILEDNPYGDLRVSGTHVPAIKSFDEDGIVIYAGSFSKVISPGMRVGFTIAPKPIVQKMVVCKQADDVHTNILAQMICNMLMTDYDYDGHLEKLRAIYRKRTQLMLNLIEEYLVPHGITYHKAEGGLFIWCTLPENINMLDFCKKSAEKKVCVVPGNAFLVDESAPCQSFRINFSTPTEEQIQKGIAILGETAKQM
ncbi:MAG: PLP-dependent aminotransferase family protein [Clostridium sp.]|nr:PLP-dependent aminotransferase family protein [Clostridium sp.]